MSELDYRRYYDLEAFLFGDVSARFHAEESIGAFDFFSIVIWKANRAKSRTATRLVKQARPGESLDAVCHRLTRLLHDAPSHEARFKALVSSPWSFALPMASAVLTVLYPDDFTVYDYRVCGELKDFGRLGASSNPERLWRDYQPFLEAVRQLFPDLSLRDKDRSLIGRSIATQLSKDIERWSSPAPEGAA